MERYYEKIAERRAALKESFKTKWKGLDRIIS